LNATVNGALPDVGVADALATGGWLAGAPDAGITKSVTLCAGTLATKPEPDTVTSASRVIAFDAVSCHACAGDPAEKFARFTVTGVEPESTFEITITVSAPSVDRSAAKTDTLSGFAVEIARTLVSPNPERLPS
jgi:hypothetical protein